MDQDELNEFVRRVPFRPYRITLSTGATFEIAHGDMAAVGFGSIIVGISGALPDSSKTMREVLVSLMHVVQVEFTDSEESPNHGGSNGQK